jgi:uncharacterized protein (DUF2267 family)
MKTGVHALEQSLRDAQGWISSVALRLNSRNPNLALTSLKATLHAVRDQLDRTGAIELGGRLPALVRGLYYDGWDPDDARGPAKTSKSFLSRIAHESVRNPRIKPERAAKAALEVIFERLPAAAMAPVIERLPESLAKLWPDEPLPYTDLRRATPQPDPEGTRRSRASPSRLRRASWRAPGMGTPNALPERKSPKKARAKQSRHYLN